MSKAGGACVGGPTPNASCTDLGVTGGQCGAAGQCVRKSCTDLGVTGGQCGAGGQCVDNPERGYCALVKAAFLPGGSMQGAGEKFPSKDDCMKWMMLMKCDPPDSATFCSRADVATQ